VDTEVLVQSVSDMLDVSFGEAISRILQTCGDRLEPVSGKYTQYLDVVYKSRR
jgi:hypothetical protein